VSIVPLTSNNHKMAFCDWCYVHLRWFFVLFVSSEEEMWGFVSQQEMLWFVLRWG